MKPHSQKFLQKRKFMMALPMLVLPFVTMIFWGLGGGHESSVQAKSTEKTGLNLELPSAHFNDEEWNKLSLYEKAERDSLKFAEEKKNDPYFKLATLDAEEPQEVQQQQIQKRATTGSLTTQAFQQKPKEVIDPNEAKVNQKLAQLYQELNKKQEAPLSSQVESSSQSSAPDPQFTSDVKKLEGMMETMKGGNQPDPEADQLNGMLEKILDIQHPDRVNERIKEQSELKKGQVFPIEAKKTEDNFSLISPPRIQQLTMDSSALVSKVFSVESRQNAFYGLEDEVDQEQQTGNAIEAVVHDTQELVAGSTVKVRLLNDVYINGKLISKGQFIYGTCSINGERLTIKINSVRDDNSLFPVSLSA